MKRIGIIQIWQESNSFNPVPTTRADFEAVGMGTGEQGLASFAEGEEVGGFVKGLKAWQEPARAIGLLMAQAWPGGPIEKSLREFFADAVVRQLERAGRLDGVLCSLHGALVAEDEADVDGFLLRRIREVVGTDIPVVATLDLHGYLTPKMTGLADALVVYHTNPHLDRFATGQRGAAVLERILSGAAPTSAAVRLPMLTTGEATGTTGPALGPVFRRLVAMEAQSDVLSASVLMVQPYLDVPELGWTTVVFTDGKPTLAHELAEELAQMCWQRREQLTVELWDARESVSTALACEGKPVVIADGADATNSGACGDSVHLLQELVKHRIPYGALTIMVDPLAVAHARSVGLRGCFDFAVGGRRDNVFSKPLPVRGDVMALQPARYVLSGHMGDRLPVDMGDSATVQIGDVTLLLVEKPGPGSSPMMYRCVGLEPEDYKIVIVKSPAGFRAEYEPFAAGVILSACPGCASPRLAELPFDKISRPLWPLDEVTDWRNVDWVRKINARKVE